MNGVNRIDEFIRSCTLNGWLVNVIDVVNRVNIHRKVNEEIEFEQMLNVGIKGGEQ